MSVKHVIVTPEEEGLRLKCWFKRHYPDLGFVHLQQKCRKGEIRLNGKRAKIGDRVQSHMVVRIPPLQTRGTEASSQSTYDNHRDAQFIRSLVIYKNPCIFALNKPANLAVQGGTKTPRHIDALTRYLLQEQEIHTPHVQNPRLVHRLDKDTSGVLLLARTKEASIDLMHAFKANLVKKVYWAIVVGCPKKNTGFIHMPLSKQSVGKGEKIVVHSQGRKSVTEFRVLQHLGKTLTLLALRPHTGRTHQLRVHMAHMGTPILGDGKYGGKKAFICADPHTKKMHLHARRITLPALLWKNHKNIKNDICITADLPEHMLQTFRVWEWKKDIQYFDTVF